MLFLSQDTTAGPRLQVDGSGFVNTPEQTVTGKDLRLPTAAVDPNPEPEPQLEPEPQPEPQPEPEPEPQPEPEPEPELEPEPQPETEPQPQPEPEPTVQASQHAKDKLDQANELPLTNDAPEETTDGAPQNVSPSLKPGSTVEVFSASQNTWLKGEVRTVEDDEVEVVYDGRVKWVERNDSSVLRVCDEMHDGREPGEGVSRQSCSTPTHKPVATATPVAVGKKTVQTAAVKKTAIATATKRTSNVVATATSKRATAPGAKKATVVTAVAKKAPSTRDSEVRRLPQSEGTEAFTQADTLLRATWHKRDQYEYKELLEVIEIDNLRLQTRYDEYKARLAQHGSQGKEQIVFHGCTEAAIDSIVKDGFKKEYCQTTSGSWQRFGTGFYFALQSSKSHEYPLDDMDALPDGEHTRSMILCKVAKGNMLETRKDLPDLKHAPAGYDSVYGKADRDSSLNYDEIVVYIEEAVLPYAIVRYRFAKKTMAKLPLAPQSQIDARATSPASDVLTHSVHASHSLDVVSCQSSEKDKEQLATAQNTIQLQANAIAAQAQAQQEALHNQTNRPTAKHDDTKYISRRVAEELRSELDSMRLTALQRRAADCGVSDTALDDAMDSEDPKASLITAIVGQEAESASAAVSVSAAKADAEPAAAAAAATEELRSELDSMRLTALQRRAADCGVSDTALDDAMDSEDPKASLITAIVGQEAESASAAVSVSA
eukprot:COSAG03_NODE_1170_length_4662_cov_33.560596_2_plen_715_part_01